MFTPFVLVEFFHLFLQILACSFEGKWGIATGNPAHPHIDLDLHQQKA
jgi:hypothetical protein